MRLRLTLLIFSICTAVILFLLSISTFSLWFLYGLLEGDRYDSLLAVRRHDTVASLVAQGEHYGIRPKERTSTAHFSRYVIGRQNDSHVLVGIPYIKEQISIRSNLERAGWSVRRLGWIIEARQLTAQDSPRGSTGFVARARQLVSASKYFLWQAAGTSFDPIALARLEAGSYPLVNRPYAALITQEEDGLSAHVQVGNSDVFTVLEPSQMENQALLKDLFISIPSGVLRYLPPSSVSEAEIQLRSRFGFVKTRPPIVMALRNTDAASVVINGSETGLAVRGPDHDIRTFVQAVETWFSEEKAYENPVRSSFRLPDGTVGFEYVPGERENPFATASLGGDCRSARSSAGGGPTIWLCANAGTATVSTSAELAQSLMDVSDTEGWRIEWSNNETGGTLWEGSRIDHIEAVGDTSQAYIRLKMEQ